MNDGVALSVMLQVNGIPTQNGKKITVYEFRNYLLLYRGLSIFVSLILS